MDWNNDGKKDFLLGEGGGFVRIYLNTGMDANPVFSGFSYVQVNGSDYNFGSYTSPCVIDWNNDGKKDLLIGEQKGLVFLLINSGTDASPVFSSSVPIQDKGVDLDVGTFSGPSVVDLNKDGAKDLLVGNDVGWVCYFENKNSDQDPVFEGMQLLYSGGYRLGVNGDARMEVVDWNNDGSEDFICGEGSSGSSNVFCFQSGDSDCFPDLAVIDFSGPSQADPGEPVGNDLNLSIINQGNCESHSFGLLFHLSEDPVITKEDHVLPYGSMVIGEELGLGTTYTVPLHSYIRIPSNIPHGLYYIGPLLDGQEEICELDEEDNYISYMIQIGEVTLTADNYSISEAGGSIGFSLDAGAANGNRKYLLLGGITGSSPGMPLPGGHVTLPVNWDLFSDLEMMLLNTIVFSDFQGFLDAEGTSTAQMNLPQLPAGSIGTIITLAYCLNKPYDFVSNHVEVYITE